MEIVITGKLSSPKREYETKIQNAGIDYKSRITMNTTHLVQADKYSTSLKTTRAKKEGILIIDEAELLNLIKNAEIKINDNFE